MRSQQVLANLYFNCLPAKTPRLWLRAKMLRGIHPRWQDVGDQAVLKEQWNAEALGYQQSVEDSMLKAALVYHGRWLIQKDANGFPVE